MQERAAARNASSSATLTFPDYGRVGRQPPAIVGTSQWTLQLPLANLRGVTGPFRVSDIGLAIDRGEVGQ